MKTKLLVINPGSTSTKIALYREEAQVWQQNIEHSAEELSKYPTIYCQLDMRVDTVLEAMKLHGDRPEELEAVVARGGLLPPLESGAYEVNEEMLDVLEHRPVNHHASNLGAAIAYRISKPLGIKSYIYDPVTVDEMIELVRITGLKEIRRHGQGHNLNMRAAALRFCRENGFDYLGANIIAAHLGGGITLSLHSNGRIIDMISDDEGAFSPERAGGLPAFKLARIAFDREMTYDKLMKKLQRGGGLMSHFGMSDARRVEEMIESGDGSAALVYDAMALSVARCVAKLAVVVEGRVDAIVLTGGLAYSDLFTSNIIRRVAFIAPVTVIPGENEMQALAEGAYRVLRGREAAKEYRSPGRTEF